MTDAENFLRLTLETGTRNPLELAGLLTKIERDPLSILLEKDSIEIHFADRSTFFFHRNEEPILGWMS